MTTPTVLEEVTCGSCGHTIEIGEWLSAYSSGSPDLDTRPPKDARFMINYSVKRCGNCGYCNDDITQAPENIESILNSEQYKRQLDDEQFPKLANEFLCKSIILESNNEIESAAWVSIHAAWNCDDNNKYVQSKYCRNRAADLINLANTTTLLKYDKKGELSILLIELYRRSEQFDKALKICSTRLQIEEEDLLKQILFFQLYLIGLQDINAYKVDDAVAYYDEKIAPEYYENNNDYIPDDSNISQRNSNDRDYFDAMTDGQLGDYDDFRGNIDDIDTWARG
jgi:hypothetical protein